MNLKLLLVFLLAISVTGVFSFVSTPQVAAQGQSTALERGYRTGYSDGYTAGYRDISDHAARDYQNKEDYKRADRSYNETWGPVEDYRDGYQQGFEAGYSAGYERAQFDSNLPVGLKRRSNTTLAGNDNGDQTITNNTTANNTPTNNTDAPVNTQSTGPIAIPRNTILALELLTPISTDVNHRGDRFQARVVEPAEYAGFIVDGSVAELKRPGKVKGTAQLQLAFDQIRSSDNRTASLRAELMEISPIGGDDGPEVDSEGGVKGRDSTKDDAAKIGAASGIGAIIGTIAGGGKGAAIGAIIGGGAGTAGVMTQRGKDIRLERGQHLKIRTSTDTGVQ
ncbi:MAG TPA: hypothetical protein VFR51_11035 [Pyrinomonadaceae bacterium]|nr:hypothetical protein [Pyrinomonadaceae bacterium]